MEEALADIRQTKNTKEISAGLGRLMQMLLCLEGRDDAASEALLLGVFAERDCLAKVRGDTTSGSDLNATVVGLMTFGTPRMRAALVDNHAALDARDLEQCFKASWSVLPADKVFAVFSPYLTAKVDAKKKDRDPAYARRSAIPNQLGHHGYPPLRTDVAPPLDPRWLDVAVRLEDLQLVGRLIRAGPAAATASLSKTFAAQVNKAKQ